MIAGMSEPFWFEEIDEIPQPARRYRSPDVVIIGAGVTGCSCALTLAQQGFQVRVHETREIGTGASGRNAGFALRGASMPYHEARVLLGGQRAQQLWQFTERGLKRLAT